MRVPPDALLDSAFKVDEFTPVLNPDMTVRLSGERYQLPRKRPFVDWMGQKVTVVVPPETDFLVVVGLDGNEYEIVKQVASTDRAGEFKTPEESSAQQTMKQLEASATERRRVRKASGRRLRRPLIDTVEGTAAPLILPRAKQPLDANLLAALAPGAVPPSSLGGRFMTYVRAAEMLQAEGALSLPLDDADKAWLQLAFAGRTEMLDTEVRAALAARPVAPVIVELQRRA